MGFQLDMDDFEYEPKWEENLPIQKPWSGGIVHWLYPKRKIVIPLWKQGSIVLEAHERMFMLQSAKPTPEEFNQVLKKNDFVFVSEYKNNLMHLSLFKKF